MELEKLKKELETAVDKSLEDFYEKIQAQNWKSLSALSNEASKTIGIVDKVINDVLTENGVSIDESKPSNVFVVKSGVLKSKVDTFIARLDQYAAQLFPQEES